MIVLFKVLASLIAVFAAIALASTLLGVLDVEDVQRWLGRANDVSPFYIILLVAILLSIDLFLAVPTLTVTLLAGYYLGITIGSLSAYAGMSGCALLGYYLGASRGERLLAFIVREQAARRELQESFQRDGSVMIVLSRSAPMLPEACACLAGATNMNLFRFFLRHTLGTVPYVFLATFLGERMRDTNPAPVVLGAMIAYALVWAIWLAWRKRRNSQKL